MKITRQGLFKSLASLGAAVLVGQQRVAPKLPIGRSSSSIQVLQPTWTSTNQQGWEMSVTSIYVVGKHRDG